MKDINWTKVVDVFNSISTTSVRIFFTLLIIAWTAWDYIHQNDVPDGQWLIFLATLAGVDMVQAAVKTAVVSKARSHEVKAQSDVQVKELELKHAKIVNGKIQQIDDDELEKELG